MAKKKILIFYDYFDPAYKAGGPIRSLVNLVSLMEEVFDFYILTTNKDHDGSILQVEIDKWIKYGKSSQVLYLSKGKRSLGLMKKIISEIEAEVIYINGIFSLSFVLFPLWALRKDINAKIVIAPRGMLQRESLSIKPIKKRFYLAFLKRFVLRRNIKWHVTTDKENLDLIYFTGQSGCIIEIGNIPNFQLSNGININGVSKRKVFGTVALISPMKNFFPVLKSFSNISQKMEYRIYGPIKDQLYWEKCLEKISNLPSNINVSYRGEITPDKVGGIISDFDYYIQPSKSENFGHSIFEAFNQGVPVIISSQTPWTGLKDKKAGWDVNLNKPNSLEEAILEAIEMDGETYLKYCKGARSMAEDYMNTNDFKADYQRLFDFNN